jgi:ATP-binding cassette subfamily B protein
VRERLGLVTATLAEDIAGMRMVQAFVREQRATENFRAVAGRYRDANMQTVVLNALYFPFVSFLATLALASYSATAVTSTSPARSRSGRCSPSCST